MLMKNTRIAKASQASTESLPLVIQGYSKHLKIICGTDCVIKLNSLKWFKNPGRWRGLVGIEHKA